MTPPLALALDAMAEAARARRRAVVIAAEHGVEMCRRWRGKLGLGQFEADDFLGLGVGRFQAVERGVLALAPEMAEAMLERINDGKGAIACRVDCRHAVQAGGVATSSV